MSLACASSVHAIVECGGNLLLVNDYLNRCELGLAVMEGLLLNRRPVKVLYIGPLYFKHFFLTIVAYIWHSGMKSAESTTAIKSPWFNPRGPLKESCRPDLL